jgi:hypothetical protein
MSLFRLDASIRVEGSHSRAIADIVEQEWRNAQAAGTGDRQLIGLDELADMDVIHGPRPACPGTYDAWLAVLRASRPRFEFTDPSFRQSRHSRPMTLAFAATASRPTAVLSNPLHLTGDQAASGARQRVADSYDMVRVGLEGSPLTATAVVACSSDLPRHLQQVLFDTADARNPQAYPSSVAA